MIQNQQLHVANLSFKLRAIVLCSSIYSVPSSLELFPLSLETTNSRKALHDTNSPYITYIITSKMLSILGEWEQSHWLQNKKIEHKTLFSPVFGCTEGPRPHHGKVWRMWSMMWMWGCVLNSILYRFSRYKLHEPQWVYSCCVCMAMLRCRHTTGMTSGVTPACPKCLALLAQHIYVYLLYMQYTYMLFFGLLMG